ncbi:hypothetical protein [Pseudaminobacter sp. NGMCC 1.201702]|uniref:hypothetical protein n=1 Tax=Pseudaminobacter sp. NGMCC 1.201702 TaxID=3391825 RepID=UPI0039EE8F58
MAESKRFERDPAEGSRSTVEKQLKDEKVKGESRETSRVPNNSGRRDDSPKVRQSSD